MKHTAILLTILAIHFPPSAKGAEAQPPLGADALALSSTEGITWKSDVLKLKLRDGSFSERILIVEFAPNKSTDGPNPPHAKAKLSLATPPEGPFKVTSSIGTSAFRDVRLTEKDGLRTITITRAIETVSHPKEKTQRILDTYWSVSFTYELTDDRLVLKGFPKDAIDWGVTTFIAPSSEITFKAVK